MRHYCVCLALLLFTACQTVSPRPEVVVRPAAQFTQALRRVPESEYPLFVDDGDSTTLKAAAIESLAYYRDLPLEQGFNIGGSTYTARELADSVDYFLQTVDSAVDAKDVQTRLARNFDVYESVGGDGNGDVTFSSYYEPTLSARLEKDGAYQYPLYARPDDLVDVDLGRFDPALQGTRIAGRRVDRAMVPYFTRAEIDGGHALEGRHNEIAWAKDPLDIFFLQIEGSGFLDVGPSSAPVRIRYDGDNGRRYRSVGQYLLHSGKYPGKSLDHAEFKRWLTAHPKDRQDILNVDERYIFFRLDTSTSGAHAYGNISVPLTAGRSIATDPKLFPKGMLAWVTTDQPVFTHASVTGKRPLQRFVLNQDEGGAIKGPGRVDFFVGHGPDADRFAGHFWQHGKLYVLIRKRIVQTP